MKNEELKVLKDNAKQAYDAADKNGKAMLEQLFPGILKPVLVTDRIKTFEDALEAAGMDAVVFNKNTENDTVDEKAYKKLKFIIWALNEGWVPDWANSSQYKYAPYLQYKSGFGFSRTDCDSWATRTTVGSRLVFKSRELAEYAAKQFIDIYNEYLTLTIQ